MAFSFYFYIFQFRTRGIEIEFFTKSIVGCFTNPKQHDLMKSKCIPGF